MEQSHIQHAFSMNANLDQSKCPQTFRAVIAFPVAVVDKRAQYITFGSPQYPAVDDNGDNKDNNKVIMSN